MYIWGKGRAACRVGSDFLSAIAGRVRSTFRRVGSGRVQEKRLVDNSVTSRKFKHGKCCVFESHSRLLPTADANFVISVYGLKVLLQNVGLGVFLPFPGSMVVNMNKYI